MDCIHYILGWVSMLMFSMNFSILPSIFSIFPKLKWIFCLQCLTQGFGPRMSPTPFDRHPWLPGNFLRVHLLAVVTHGALQLSPWHLYYFSPLLVTWIDEEQLGMNRPSITPSHNPIWALAFCNSGSQTGVVSQQASRVFQGMYIPMKRLRRR